MTSCRIIQHIHEYTRFIIQFLPHKFHLSPHYYKITWWYKVVTSCMASYCNTLHRLYKQFIISARNFIMSKCHPSKTIIRSSWWKIRCRRTCHTSQIVNYTAHFTHMLTYPHQHSVKLYRDVKFYVNVKDYVILWFWRHIMFIKRLLLHIYHLSPSNHSNIRWRQSYMLSST